VIPLHLSRSQLREGYIRVMHRLYQATAYFKRVEALYFGGVLGQKQLGREKYWTRHPWVRARQEVFHTLMAVILLCRLLMTVKEHWLRREYGTRLWRAVAAAVPPTFLSGYIYTCALHYHYHKLVQGLREGRLVSTL